MASVRTTTKLPHIEYPESDGRPVGETPEHRDNLLHLVEMLRVWLAGDDMAYVSGNVFLYYVPGNRLRHLSPDVFVVRGIPKAPERRRYLVWEERKAPDVVIELTSPSTYEEDLDDKFAIYRDILRVQEYFLFDPLDECLEPRLQGFRLRNGVYAPIRRVKGRLPSKVLGLHLEYDDWELRLFDPVSRKRLPTPEEPDSPPNATAKMQERHRLAAERDRQDAERARLAAERDRQDAERDRLASQRDRQDLLAAQAEIERLKNELAQLRGEQSQ